MNWFLKIVGEEDDLSYYEEKLEKIQKLGSLQVIIVSKV